MSRRRERGVKDYDAGPRVPGHVVNVVAGQLVEIQDFVILQHLHDVNTIRLESTQSYTCLNGSEQKNELHTNH